MPNKKQIANEELPFMAPAEPAAMSGSATKTKSKPWLASLTIAAILALLAILGLLLRLGQLQRQMASLKANQKSQTIGQQAAEADQLVAEVGKLIILPDNEQPTIATVQDLSKLQGQPFFANAQIGDKVLIYTNAQKAILYRPSTNQIIELAPLNLGNAQPTAATTSVLTLEIRNGSGKTGAGAALKVKLQDDTDIIVSRVGNARTTYPQTILVVPSTLENLAAVQHLAGIASATLESALPDGEPASAANLLVILGRQ